MTRLRRAGSAKRTGRTTYSVTSARKSLTDDLDSRTRRYFFSMSVRTVCFLLAVLTDGPVRWVFVVGALVLPYVAVVIANAGREPAGRPDEIVLPSRLELGGGAPREVPTVVLEVDPDDAMRPGATPRSGTRPGPTPASEAPSPEPA